jgi:hypothetical protein
LVFATLMLGGLLAAGVQGLVTKHVARDTPLVEVEPAPVVEDVGVVRDGELQLILLAGIVLVLAVAGLGVKAFVVLRKRAEVTAQHKKAGAVLVFVGGWML